MDRGTQANGHVPAIRWIVEFLQNEDANATLVIIDPANGTQTPDIVLGTQNHGGGFDDVPFVGGKVYLSVSAPARAFLVVPRATRTPGSTRTLACTAASSAGEPCTLAHVASWLDLSWQKATC